MKKTIALTDICHMTYAADCSANERFAATELKKYLEQITGCNYTLSDDSAPYCKKEIILGAGNAHLKDCGFVYDSCELKNEGFVIKTCGENIIIVGGKQRGLMYGVYTFLEKFCGCRWLAPDCEVVPKNSTISIGEINDIEKPAFEYRESHFKPVFDNLFLAKLKCNSSRMIPQPDMGGRFLIYPFAHSFNQLVPVDKYFDSHPEYFSEIEGKRIREHTQLCLTNPDVVDIAVATALEWIKNNPEISAVDLSQNDCGNPCQCEKCKAVYERTQSYSGSIIEFANAVAQRVTEVYPDMLFTVFAYQYSRKAPVNTKAHPHIAVRLCGFECCCVHPVETATCSGTVISGISPTS
ncbi:MAG TPA: DUF4838 domain-containing protein, partial [Bacillota bacterium]|nr:DUF4838 domain-containing protein [Bacillota bacterium]